ncbi:RNA polymerase sigma factor [Alphaproteobacteria bacterium]|nr:RNA polymerase sigma factor [Alphaproteobacteria bacterium]
MSQPETELMELVAKGDRAAFAELMDLLMPRALRFVARLTGDAEEAEDIVQDVFIRVWVKAGKWRKQGDGSAKSWIYRLLYNRTIDVLRRKKRMVLLPDGWDVADEASPLAADALAEQEMQDSLMIRAMAGLPTQQKAAVQLFYYDGLSQKEAAASLGLSLSAFEALLFRAREGLKRRVSAQNTEGGMQ